MSGPRLRGCSCWRSHLRRSDRRYGRFSPTRARQQQAGRRQRHDDRGSRALTVPGEHSSATAAQIDSD
jgi:hypothetical protein